MESAVRLRKRNTPISKETALPKREDDDEDDDSENHQRSAAGNNRKSTPWWKRGNFILLLLLVLHGCAVVSFIMGLLLQSRLHTGEECDMTYSMRKFLQIETTGFSNTSSYNKITNQYKLYKFVDQRDPRYQSLLRKASSTGTPLSSSDPVHCAGIFPSRLSPQH